MQPVTTEELLGAARVATTQCLAVGAGEDGLVRVRLSADSNQGGCLYLELGLEGRR